MADRLTDRAPVRRLRLARLAEGAGLGVLVWMALGQLGVLQIAGLDKSAGAYLSLAAGAVLGAWRAGAVARGVAGAVAAAYVVVAFTPLAAALAGRTVRRDPLGPRPSVDAVAVLSADVRADGLVGYPGLTRTVAGVAWARALDRPLVLSVVRDEGYADAPGSEADQRRLAALGGVARLYFVDSVHATRDEAVREAALARRMGWRRLLVVTSPAHSRRACAAYERAGVAVACAPAPSREYTAAGPHPVGGPRERLAAFRDWLYETFAWATYRARGWV